MGILESFRGLFGVSAEERERAVRKGPKPGLDREIGELPVYLQLTRIGGKLTPSQVSEVLRMADLGRMARFADLANEARQKDCHLQSILGTREMCAASLEWEIVPCDGDSARLKDRKQAEWISEVLKAADGTSTNPAQDDNVCGLRGLISHLAGGAYHGRAVSETLFDREAGRFFPVAWSNIAPRRIIYNQFDGHICFWDEVGSTPYPGIDIRSGFAPGKMIVHQPRVNGDVPVREGLARDLVWMAMFRTWDLRDWLALGELAWKPWRTGTYQKGADKDDVDLLRSALRNMSSSGVAIFPDTTDAEIKWPTGSKQGGMHSELFAVLGSEMSKAVLGQTLTTEQGSKGSQALGRVHDNVRRDIMEFDAASIAETLRRDLLGPLVRMNFGADAKVPVFRFLTDDSVDLLSFSSGIKNLRDAGLKIPAAWVRDRIGAPEPDEDDELLGEDEEDVPIDPATGLPAEPVEPNETPEPGKPPVEQGEAPEPNGEKPESED